MLFKNIRTLLFIVIVTALAGMVAWPTDVLFVKGFRIHPGLDLKGGTQLTYELNVSEVEESGGNVGEAVQGAADVIERRINQFGLTEPSIQTSKIDNKNALTVELPGVSDIEEAKLLIGQTAQLEFYKPKAGVDATTMTFEDFEPSGLTGSDLKNAQVVFTQAQTGAAGTPQVQLQFNDAGAQKFKELTTQNIGKPIAIYLDGMPISAPIVQTPITDGVAVISGNFTVEIAKQLAIQLNAGALPVPMELVSERTIGATLGVESVQKSLMAGVVGFILIGIFMTVYYRLAGFLATIALAIYVVINIAIFEWLAITLTLAGIAGFILSIGIAVDANVLIFERLREELNAGKPMNLAIEEGFRRAMASIADSNVSSLITAVILYFSTTGLVKNFAVTFSIGIIVSLFTAIFVTRALMKVFLKERAAK